MKNPGTEKKVQQVVIPPDSGLSTRTPSNQTRRSNGRALTKASNVRASYGRLYNSPGVEQVTVSPELDPSGALLIYQANLQQSLLFVLGDRGKLYSVGPSYVPSVDAGSDDIVAGLVYTLQGSASGYLGAAVGSTWTQLSGAGTSLFADAGDPASTVTVTDPGLYVFRLSVSDGLITVTDEVTIRFITADAGDDFTTNPI